MDRPTFLRWTARIRVRTDRPTLIGVKCDRWTARTGVIDGQTHLPHMDNKDRCEVINGQIHLPKMDSKDRCEDGQTHPPHMDSKDRCEGWTGLSSSDGQQG